MAEIPNVVPGEPIESNWGNEIRDRAVMRYPDATARDFSDPFPDVGQLSWLDSTGQIDRFGDDGWKPLALDDLKVDKVGDTMTGPLVAPLFTGPVDGQFVRPPDVTGVGTSGVEAYTTGVLPATIGSWLVTFTVGRFTYPTEVFAVTLEADLRVGGLSQQFARQFSVPDTLGEANLIVMGTFSGGSKVDCFVVSGSSANKNARDMFVTVTEINAPPEFP